MASTHTAAGRLLNRAADLHKDYIAQELLAGVWKVVKKDDGQTHCVVDVERGGGSCKAAQISGQPCKHQLGMEGCLWFQMLEAQEYGTESRQYEEARAAWRAYKEQTDGTD